MCWGAETIGQFFDVFCYDNIHYILISILFFDIILFLYIYVVVVPTSLTFLPYQYTRGRESIHHTNKTQK